ncbi:MAG: 16S rRNA (uracil(1498)-N(3))-methyltransferase [Treponema sp.]|nr:16S rRNA (uracil(1498)-N(3))-methyltransferase [Treponema sp.]
MRQLILQKNQDKNGLVLVEGKDFHYLRQVLRVKVGDMVNLRLADGLPYDSTVCKIDDSGKKITLQLCGVVRGPHQPHEIQFTLFQFIPKPQKLELIVRQATECGVKNIIPVISEYAQKGSVEALSGKKIERLERIVREARQQSGSPVDTKVFKPVTVEQAIEIWNKMKEEAGGEENAAGFVLSERAVESGPSTPSTGSGTEEGTSTVCIFCGNEGGISPDELELLTKKALLQPVHFSVNILRCETAALYGIAAVQTAILGF